MSERSRKLVELALQKNVSSSEEDSESGDEFIVNNLVSSDSSESEGEEEGVNEHDLVSDESVQDMWIQTQKGVSSI